MEQIDRQMAWISQARWDALTLEQQEGFIPLCPGFVVELQFPERYPQRPPLQDGRIY